MIDSIVNNCITEREELNEKANRREKPENLARRIASDKALRVKHLMLLKILKMTDIKEGLSL